MKQLKRKIFAFLVAACLICMNIVPAFADTTTDATAPAAADVRQEAQLTASYLMNNADYSNIADTSSFYNASRNLLLSIRSGYDCSKQTEAYLNSVKSLVNKDGTLNVSLAPYACPNDVLSSYAYLLMVLAVTGYDAANFNGCNIVAAFDNLLANITDSDLTYTYDWNTYSSTGINPYHIGTFYSAVNSYKASLTNADKAIAAVKKALTTLCAGGNGIDYSGTSADNNGISLVPFASAYSDADVKSAIDSAITYVKTLADPDGSTQGQYWNEDYSKNWYASNPDATALALALFAQYNVSDYAATNYNALIKNYKSSTTPGCYTYQGYDSVYSAQDSMIGLVTYQYVLEGKVNPFDVSAEVKAIADAKNTPVEEPSTEAPSENPTEAGNTDTDITSPATGDVNVYMYLLLAAACAATFTGVTVYNKKSAR
uniref:hypothetical protein n=1 Tax=Lachnospira eligens TaxID=39485 RepID=UPI004028E4F0